MKFRILALASAVLLFFSLTACSAPRIDASVSGDSGTTAYGAEYRSEAEWKETLTKEEFRILRQKGTERAFSGEYWNHHEHGVYTCGGCGLPLFESETKFDSGTGWPSFWQPVDDAAVVTEVDTSYGMRRTEILCSRCGGHLGHVFNDGPRPTGLRYCVNSVSLDFEPAGAAASDPSAPEHSGSEH